MSMTHVAGAEVAWHGRYIRQRCSWCGAVLIDVDLTTVAVAAAADPDGEDVTITVPTWEVGGLVRHDGNAWSAVPSDDGTVPDDCCMNIDPAVTA